MLRPHATASVLTLGFIALAGVLEAATITVNTADNADFSPGKMNLVSAITNAASGDTIAFAIPGAGPHHLVTPVGGYPVLHQNNLLIDGYTQSGSSSNSNTILAANNAVLKIVLDSINGEGTSNAGLGFGATETGVLFLMGTNCHVRGLCFLGIGNSSGANDRSAINIGNTAYDTHVSGCWIGVDVDGTTLHTFDRGTTAFGDVVAGVDFWPRRVVIGVKAGPADTAGARAQQNVIVGSWVDVFMECRDMVIAGNKLNVLPDGLHDVDVLTVAPLEAVIETGRVNNNMRVGTDGDGLNDAEERNVFGGVSVAGDNNIIEIYSQNGDVTVGAACTNIIIAGNYFGLGVDGVTRFTNSMDIVDHFTRRVNGVDSDCQFGSDFNGVSDDIEGNVIYMNNPFAVLYPDPTLAVLPPMLNLTAEGRLSFRGNKLVNNNLPVYSYANAADTLRAGFTNFFAPYLSTNGEIIPSLSSNCTAGDIIGVCPSTNGGSYSNIFIDVYVLDPEGWANGVAVAGAAHWFALTDSATFTNGWPQGKSYLGSFADNGPLDRDPAVGKFNFNANALGLTAGTVITVTANYSMDPMGTTRGRTHTSNYSNPIQLRAPLKITSFTRSGSTLTINWSGGGPNYTVQRSAAPNGPWSDIATGLTGTSTTDTLGAGPSFYRVLGN